MPIETTHDPQRDLTIHVVTGPAREEEMYAALEAPGDGVSTRDVLWDMSGADVMQVTPGILRQFVKKAAELGVDRKGGRTAIVAPEDLQYGLARMSEVFADMVSSPYSLRAFRTREEAIAWLEGDDPR